MNRKGISGKTVRALLSGGMMAMGVTLVCCALCAWLISKETMGEGAATYCIPMMLILSSFAGGKVAIGKLRERRLVTGLAAAGVYFLVLLAVTALFFDGQYRGLGVTVPAVLSGGAGAAILGNREKKRSVSRKSKMKHR
jgi:putative membrane protein (TIGR04086 family)